MPTRNTRLILRSAGDPVIESEGRDDPRTIKFPGAVRDVVGRPAPGVMSVADLAAAMERTLDRMQDSLQRLKREVDAPMRLPFGAAGDEGPDPRPAA